MRKVSITANDSHPAGGRNAYGVRGSAAPVIMVVLLVLTAAAALVASRLPQDEAGLAGNPLVARLCEHVDCSFLEPKPYADPAQIKVSRTLIYADQPEGRVRLRLSLTNAAERPQPLPLLSLQLFDGDGLRVEERKIKPAAPGGPPNLGAGETRQFDLHLDNVPPVVAKYTVTAVGLE